MTACLASPTGAHHWLLAADAEIVDGDYYDTGYCLHCGEPYRRLRFLGHIVGASWHQTNGQQKEHHVPPTTPVPATAPAVVVPPPAWKPDGRRAHRTNATGYMGVTMMDSGRFKAVVRINGRNTIIGHYDTAAEAGAAYTTKAREVRGEASVLAGVK